MRAQQGAPAAAGPCAARPLVVPPRRGRVGFLAVCLAYCAIILDGSVLNLAIPVIRGSLGGSMTSAQWVLDGSDVPTPGRGLAEQVRLTGATARSGRRLWFASNWDHTPAGVTFPAAGSCLRSGARLAAGDTFELPPWSVEVLAED